MSDSYRTITAIFRGRTANAFWVAKPASRGGGHFPIARSLLHGADELKVDKLNIGDEFTFRLVEWKAEALGFA